MSRSRHCLTRQTASLARQTASLAGQTLSHPAHSLSGQSDTPCKSEGERSTWQMGPSGLRIFQVLRPFSRNTRNTRFPARTVKIRWHEQLQQKISNLSVLVASQMDITSYHFDRFKVPWETSWKPRQGKARGRFLLDLPSWRMRDPSMSMRSPLREFAQSTLSCFTFLSFFFWFLLWFFGAF